MRGSLMKPETLSLEAALEEPLRFESDLTVSAAALDRQPLLSLSLLHLSGDVRRIEGGYALTARLVYEGELECSRCLCAYPFSEDETFSLVLSPRGPSGSDEIELEPTDLDILFYDDSRIALAPIAEERVQIALPMKPLCRPDCRGLCPSCGKDLNLGACACAREAVDPRWGALRALREKV